jgi:hypothetical protein
MPQASDSQRAEWGGIGGIGEDEKVVFVEQPESAVVNDDEMEQKIRKLTDDFVSGLMHVFREYR